MNTPLAPLTPADCDLRDFPFMGLDVKRLRDSDMAMTQTPEACWAGVLLWCASWHQVPAASLPDNDRVLSSLSGYGRVVKEWLKHKAGALHGWVKCSDGRLYHKTVAEKANAAWKDKLAHQYAKMSERVRKSNKTREEKKLPQVVIPSFEEWVASGRAEPLALAPLTPPQNLPAESATASGNLPAESANLPAEFQRKTLLKGEGEGEGEGEVLNTHTPPAQVNVPAACPPLPADAPSGGACDAHPGRNLPTEPLPSSVGTSTAADTATGVEVYSLDNLPPAATPNLQRSQMAGAVCLALKADGMASTNPSHPELLALLDAGASVDCFLQAARAMREKDIKPSRAFAYVLGTVKGQMKQAAEIAAKATASPHPGPQFTGQPTGYPARTLNKQEALEARNREVGRLAAIEIRAQIAADAAKNTGGVYAH